MQIRMENKRKLVTTLIIKLKGTILGRFRWIDARVLKYTWVKILRHLNGAIYVIAAEYENRIWNSVSICFG